MRARGGVRAPGTSDARRVCAGAAAVTWIGRQRPGERGRAAGRPDRLPLVRARRAGLIRARVGTDGVCSGIPCVCVCVRSCRRRVPPGAAWSQTPSRVDAGCHLVRPRPGRPLARTRAGREQRSRRCAMPTTKDFKLEELSKYFHLPEKAVAKELGICLTSLKKICRSYGVTRAFVCVPTACSASTRPAKIRC